MQNWTPAPHNVSATLLDWLHVSFRLVKASRKFLSLMAGRRNKNMSRVAAELLNKSETLIMACCIVQHDGSDVFGVSTFYSFSPGSVKWHISSARLWNSRDVLRFECLTHPSRGKKNKKYRKEKWPASEKLMTCSACLSGRVAVSNLKLSGYSLTVSQNFPRGPVWFPQSLDHISSPCHLQVSSPVWLQRD